MAKIVVAAGLYPPDIGGPATYARMIEEELPKRGFEITIIPFGMVRRYPKIIRHFVYAVRLFKASKDVDVVYALDSISVGLPALLVSKLRKKKFLVRLGGDYAWEQGRQRFGLTATLDEYTEHRTAYGMRVRFLAWLQDLVVARAAKVIVPSEYLKSVVTTWHGVVEERVVVIYSALFPLSVSGTKEDLRKQLSYNGTVLVSVARLVPWKGFEVLLEGVAQLTDTIPDISLVIVGDGPDRKLLEEKAGVLGITDRVRFTGSLSKDALGAAVKAADVFVLNTGYEGLSHQILEVMDLSVPVITTAVGGNVELVQDGVNGLLIPYNDVDALCSAVGRMHEQETLRDRCTQNARAQIQNFDKANVLDILADVLRDTL